MTYQRLAFDDDTATSHHTDGDDDAVFTLGADGCPDEHVGEDGPDELAEGLPHLTVLETGRVEDVEALGLAHGGGPAGEGCRLVVEAGGHDDMDLVVGQGVDHQGDLLGAVGAANILQHFMPPAAAKIQINIGGIQTSRIQKPFKQQIKFFFLI